jgi:RimJ/RimL family protein N-acetyltransferase
MQDMTSALAPQTHTDIAACLCYVGGERLSVVRDGADLVVRDQQQTRRGRWQLIHDGDALLLKWQGPCSGEPAEADQLAVLEAVFTLDPQRRVVTLLAPFATPHGLALPSSGGRHTVHREMFFQQPALWLGHGQTPVPLQYILSGDRRHPRRAPKREGILYRRHIPWLQQTFSFRSLDIDDDLARFNRWMNDPAVAQIWQEQGDLDKHRRYLDAIAADPHMQAMIACLDGEPFGYFEAYWAKENRIGPFYDADDYDRGWHVLIGEPAFRGKACATAWLTSISHYLFLDDPRTRRIVGEPRADHHQQIRNLDRSGYAKVKEFDFPHKRALLVMLLRERYFTDTLWWPRDDDTPTQALSSATPSSARS